MEEADCGAICRHSSEAERGLHATLNSVDLEQALVDGWRVLRVYELYDWGAAPTTDQLFKSMIAHLIKGKVQSKTGAENIPQAKKQEMIRAWAEIGIDLSSGEWRSAPSRYQFYKVLLNSLWGKLAQNQMMRTSTKFVNQWSELDEILR